MLDWKCAYLESLFYLAILFFVLNMWKATDFVCINNNLMNPNYIMNKSKILITEKSRNFWLKWILDIKKEIISDKNIVYVAYIYDNYFEKASF